MAANPTPPAKTQPAGIQKPDAFDLLARELGFRAKVEADDASDRKAQVTAILEAETEEEMWDSDERPPLGGRDLVDVEMTIHSFTVKYGAGDDPDVKSMFKDPETGRDMYLMVTATRIEDGEPMTWNTSAAGLVAKLTWLDHHGKLPVDCVIRDVKLGKRAVLKLKPLPKRATQATIA